MKYYPPRTERNTDLPQAQVDIQQLSRSVDALITMPEFQGLEIPEIPALPPGDHSGLPSVPSRPHRKQGKRSLSLSKAVGFDKLNQRYLAF